MKAVARSSTPVLGRPWAGASVQRIVLRAFLALAVLGAVLSPFQARAGSDRVALVIGMAHYEHITALDNTANDARLIADTLQGIGFDVTTLIDSRYADLRKALDDFAFRSETADLALIYFAGHGVEVAGENFLVPVDANVRSNKDVQRQSVSLKDFEATVDRARKMRIVILDSCRNNPFGDMIDFSDPAAVAQEAATAAATTRSAAGGMAAPSPDRGSLVAFAARDGEVALDGMGANSPFATALAGKLKEPGLEISLMFRQVRDMVMQETFNQQEPHTYGSLPGEPFFIAGTDGAGKQIDAEDRQVAWSEVTPDQEQQFRQSAQEGNTRSMLALAMMWLNPNDKQRYNRDEAIKLLERASEAGDREAMFELAKNLEQGVLVKQDIPRALELYRKSADQEFGDALNNMGFFYAKGLYGLPNDLPTALSYFERAANVRHREAMYNYAQLINAGMVPGKGPADAAEYLYMGIRAGSKRVFDLVSTRPDAFSRETLKAFQAKLAEHGFYDGSLDGAFGEGTLKGIRLAYGLTG